eukprot:2108688-Prymnesium_polylepis.1
MRALVAVDVDKIAGGVVGCVAWPAVAAGEPLQHRQLQRILGCGLRRPTARRSTARPWLGSAAHNRPPGGCE